VLKAYLIIGEINVGQIDGAHTGGGGSIEGWKMLSMITINGENMTPRSIRQVMLMYLVMFIWVSIAHGVHNTIIAPIKRDSSASF